MSANIQQARQLTGWPSGKLGEEEEEEIQGEPVQLRRREEQLACGLLEESWLRRNLHSFTTEAP